MTFQITTLSVKDLDYRDPFEIRRPDDQAFNSHRYSRSKVIAQGRAIEENFLLKFVMNAVPQIIMILNDKRQLVFGNQALQSTLGLKSSDDGLGLRPGELLGCVHAVRSKEGCGSTQFCKHCGSFKVLMGSLAGESKAEECRIIIESNGENEAKDLKVSSAPFTLNEQDYIFLHISDISLEKRKQALERIFFHDILNAVGGVKNILEITSETARGDNKELLDLGLQQAVSVIEEIKAQKALSAAEAHELRASFRQTSSLEVIKNVIATYTDHKINQNNKIQISPEVKDVVFRSDPVLLKRVLGNMLKNALESSSNGEQVEIGSTFKEELILFWVKNSQIMSQDIQLQVFKRSFSTKGLGRGLGTYSIKLLGEEYLKGKVWFVSEDVHGTIFYLELPLHVG